MRAPGRHKGTIARAHLGSAVGRCTRVLRLGVCLALAGAPAWGQIAPDGALKLTSQFNFSNPGARSLGLAGAFVARADDATAAYANPAGLIHLRSPEISLEGRHWRTALEIRDASGDPTVFDSSQTGASFVALSYPVRRFTLALYRHELANVDISGRGAGFRSADLDLEITGVGLSAGFEISRSFRVGLSVVGYQSDLRGAATTVGGDSSRVAGDGDELGFTLGYQADLAPDWSFGFVLREGPSFDVDIDSGAGVRSETFAVPDLAGAGLAWQVTHRLVASLDYYFIQYSKTVDSERTAAGQFVAPDAHEARLGFEYTIWEYSTSPAFRLGVWRDPDHRIRWKTSETTPAALQRIVEFPPGDDEIHLALGFGVVVGRLQLDVAADFSEAIDTYSLSFVLFL